MRPYWTIIKDSFAEALASRVLWIVFVVLTLILLAVAPLSITEQRASQISPFDIDLPKFISELNQSAQEEEDSPGKRVWEVTDGDFQQRIKKFADQEDRGKLSFREREKLLDGLNTILTQRELYREAAWQNTRLSRATKELLDRDPQKLSTQDIRVVNRLLMLDGFDSIRGNSDEEVHVHYLWWDVTGPVPFGKTLLQPVVDQLLANILRYLVGTAAVFVSILVTAAMIPHAFEAGAIDLLLSKPVTRSLLFLVKFFGGCVFILLNSTYFIVGIWLIFGMRLGMWNHSILWCIPILLFQFIVYYSVSAWAAVQWKSPIVSVVITFLFLFACFGVGTAKLAIEANFIAPKRIVSLTSTDEAITGVTSSQQWLAWREGTWETMFRDSMQRRFGSPVLIGPVYSEETQQLIYMQKPRFRRRGFGPFQSRSSISSVQWQNGRWQKQDGSEPPPGSMWLFHHPRPGTVVIAESGILQFVGETEGINLAEMLGFSSPFVPLGPAEPLKLSSDCAAAMDPKTADLVLLDDQRLLLLSYDDEQKAYQISADKTLADIDDSVMLTFSQNRVVMMEAGGRVSILNAPELEIIKQFHPVGEVDPYMVTACQDAYAILTHAGQLVVLDGEGSVQYRLGNDVSAVAFDQASGQLLIADWGQRLTTVDTSNYQILNRDAPPLNVLEFVYRYGVQPVYTLFPKPGELGNLISYAMTDEITLPDGPPGFTGNADLRAEREEISIWGPLWSSSLFVLIVLAATCFHLQRVDI